MPVLHLSHLRSHTWFSGPGNKTMCFHGAGRYQNNCFIDMGQTEVQFVCSIVKPTNINQHGPLK